MNEDFSRGEHLINHFKIHTGEKAYQCNQCQKSFSRYSHSKSHLKLHTNNKPYPCNQCQDAFSHALNLNKPFEKT